MQREAVLIDPQSLGQRAIEYLLIGGLGWLISRVTLQAQMKRFEEEAIRPLREKVSKFEGMASTFVTREELKAAIVELKVDFKEAVSELKALLRELQRER